MNAPSQLLNRAIAGRYRIKHELGQGATSVVYLAHDTVHGRDVAVKVLRRELAEAISAERFLKEIRTTAALQHPHIVPVLDSGQENGFLYCVMPYMSGGTLRTLLAREKQLPLDQVITIGVKIARALAYAHSRNVVHRDVKPENILFADGNAFIADFGIARAIERSVGDPSTTSTGIVRGTPAYMSPEQASGLHTYDGRSDIYSLGCVLYEMVAGIAAFVGPTPQSVVAQRLAFTPRPVSHYRPRTPPAFEEVLSRALATVPADRYQAAGEFADALEGVRDAPPAPPTPAWWRRKTTAAIALVAVAAVVAAAVLVGRASRNAIPPPTPAAPRIAVLPFDNHGQQSDQFFADGLTDELTTRVAAISGLSVVSRTSAMQYDRRERSLRQIGRDLGVDYILSGSIRTDRRRDSAFTRVSPELTRVSTDEVVWRDRQDAALVPGELFAIQSAIAESVAVWLKVAILLPERATLQARPTNNFDAYEAYLRGNVHAARLYDVEPMRLAIGAYERATTLDPSFALAFAKLAQVQSTYYAASGRRPDQQLRAARALERAIALDSALPATRLARGYYHHYVRRNYDSAMVYLSAAQRSEPNNAELLSALGLALMSQGKWNDALAAMTRATHLDPRSQKYFLDLGTAEFWMRKYAEADRDLRRANELAPDYLPPYVTRSYNQVAWKGDLQGALRVLGEATREIDTTVILNLLIPRFRPYIAMLDSSWHNAIERTSLRTLRVDSGAYYLVKAELYSRRNDARARPYYDSARVVFEARVHDRVGEPFFHSELGAAYAGLGRRADAVREGKRAVELLPRERDVTGNSFFALSLARIYIFVKDYDAAIRELRKQLDVESLVSRAALRTHPDYALLRTIPEFQALIRER